MITERWRLKVLVRYKGGDLQSGRPEWKRGRAVDDEEVGWRWRAAMEFGEGDDKKIAREGGSGNNCWKLGNKCISRDK